MTQTTSPFTLEEAQTIRHLLKITGVRILHLDQMEIRKIVPKQDKLQNFTQGELGINQLTIWIHHPTKARTRISVELKDHYPELLDTPDNYEELIDWHYQTLFNILERIFGEEWIMARIAEEFTRKYDAISGGQAEAVVRKFLPRARGNEAMSSTTRSQIHRLRQKIVKYRTLIDAFEPLMSNESQDLAEIANNMPKQFVYGQGPYVTSLGAIQTDALKFDDIVSALGQPAQLEKAPSRTEYGTTADIMETREKLIEKGLDPDKEPPAVDVAETVGKIQALEGYVFHCQWCDHTEPYEVDDDNKIKPKMHHNYPMFLRIPRRNSDY